MPRKAKRLSWLLALGTLLCLGTYFYIQFYWTRPIGSGPAGPVVSEQPFADAPWTACPIKVLGIGDSVTAGLGARSSEHTYFRRLISNPSDELEDMRGKSLSVVIPNLQAENLAVSGSTSEDHFRVLQDQFTVQPSELFGLVLMTCGGNDLIHSYGRRPPTECAMYGATILEAKPWIESFGIRLHAMLDRINKCFPSGCEIYLADIYDPTDGVGDAPSIFLPPWPDGLAIHAAYNQIIHECGRSRENVFIVPLHQTFLGHGSHCRQFWRTNYDSTDPHYWFFTNIEDPNDRGYDAIRRVFINTILTHTKLRIKSS